jgi:hypothetical protein
MKFLWDFLLNDLDTMVENDMLLDQMTFFKKRNIQILSEINK